MKIFFDLCCHFGITNQLRGMNNHGRGLRFEDWVWLFFNESCIIRWIYSFNYTMWNPIKSSHMSQCPEDYFCSGQNSSFLRTLGRQTSCFNERLHHKSTLFLHFSIRQNLSLPFIENKSGLKKINKTLDLITLKNSVASTHFANVFIHSYY